MTQAIPAYGTLLKVGDGMTPENFTTVLQVQDITLPPLKAETEDVTAHDSPGGWTELIPTLLDGGEVKFGVLYVPSAATHNATTGLIADLHAKTLRHFQAVFPDGAVTTWSFSGYVTGFAAKAPVKAALKADVTISITGEPTLA